MAGVKEMHYVFGRQDEKGLPCCQQQWQNRVRGDVIHPEPVPIHPRLVPDVEELGEARVGREGDVPEVETAVLVLADHADRR